MGKKSRLALDLGSNSIGWVLFQLDDEHEPVSLIDAGVRIFSNSRVAKTHVPLSVERREARGARRRRDRFLRRKKHLVNLLKTRGMIPERGSAEEREFVLPCPYELRHQALSRPLNPLELGRVFLHLCQRRGFKSNRKDLKKEEGGKSLGSKIGDLQNAMQEADSPTLGSFLYINRVCKGLSPRFRTDEVFYPTRKMYEDEFTAIKEKQSPTATYLSVRDWGRIHYNIFNQRPLREQQPGKCLFNTEQNRALKALPSFQRFRLYQQLANVKVVELGKNVYPLSAAQKKQLAEKLLKSKNYKYDQARKLLKLPDDSHFNLEIGKNSFSAAKYFFGDATSHLLAGKKYFGPSWHKIDPFEADEIVEALVRENDEEVLRKLLVSKASLSEEQIKNLIDLSEEQFEKGYSQFCIDVLQGLSSYLCDNPSATYDEACQALGYHHSDFRPEDLRDRLPYYGEILRSSTKDIPDTKVEEERRFGKIANPTVHVALNQLRKVCNKLFEVYGKPAEIVIEVARDLPLSDKGIREHLSTVKKNEKANERWAKKLDEYKVPNTYANRRRLRLWEELAEEPLARCCPYSGEVIGLTKLFSSDIEVDHILPQSKTFTNHHSNLILCTRQANKLKGDRSPFEAFGGSSSPFPYQAILSRAQNLPPSKARKFNPDAMIHFADTDSFLERQLNDTRFISKAAGKYLQSVCRRVFVSRGGLTAYLRSEIFELNKILNNKNVKNRDDHRHHAIDAFLVGLSTPKTLKRVLSSSKSSIQQLIAQLKNRLQSCIVSHRPNHSAAKKLFEETNYGPPHPEGLGLTIRRDVATLPVSSTLVSERLQHKLDIAKENGTEVTPEILSKLFVGAKKVKVFKKDASAIPVVHPKDSPRFKRWISPMDITRIEFWHMPKSRELESVAYSAYEALDTKRYVKKPHPAAKKIMTIHKGDYLRLSGADGSTRTVLVESLRPANKIILFTEHNVSKNENAVGRTVSFSGLEKARLRVIHVDEIGRVKDPGPWWVSDAQSS